MTASGPSMTDDPSESDDRTPDGTATRPDPAAEGERVTVRSFGRRPDFAHAATVLSHNFRAPLMPELPKKDAVPSPVALEERETLQADDAVPVTGNDQVIAGSAPADAGGPDFAEEPDLPAVEAEIAAVENSPQEHAVEAELPAVPQAGQLQEATGEPTADSGTEAVPYTVEAAQDDTGNAAVESAVHTVADSVEDSVEDSVADAVEDGTGDDAFSGPGVRNETERPGDPGEPEPIDGSLLAIPALGDTEEEDEGDAEVDGDGGGETRKREIRFDGKDEPLGQADWDETEPAAADMPEPEPESVALPANEAELARRLGISFREGAATSAELELQRSREEAEIARKLGIQFRENGGGGAVEVEGDELSEAARRLGISFRDEEDARPVKKKASMTGRLIMLFTLFSGLAGLAMLLFFGESLFEAVFG